MASSAEAAPYIFSVWQKLVSWPYIADLRSAGIPFSVGFNLAITIISGFGAKNLSVRSSWLDSTPLPNDCYRSPHVNTLLQLPYILMILEAVLSPVCAVTSSIMMSRRETTYTKTILVIGVITISTVVAGAIPVLQSLTRKSALDMQAILSIRPDLSSADVLTAWDDFIGRTFMPRLTFILYLLAGGYQIVALSARHLITSPERLPKQFRPFVMEKHKRKSAIGEPEASTLGTKLLNPVDSGPLAKLFDDYEKRGLISTHTDLEVCQAISPVFVHAYTVFTGLS